MNNNYSTPIMPPSHSVAAYAQSTNATYTDKQPKKKGKLSEVISFFLKNQTYSLFSIILLSFFTPVLTNMAGTRDNHPALQDFIKVVCYITGFSASIYGVVAENDKKLIIQRVREDAKTNTDFAIEKILLRRAGTERLGYAFSLMEGGNSAPERMLGNSPFTWHEKALPPSRDNAGDPGYSLMPMNQTADRPAPAAKAAISGNYTAPNQGGEIDNSGKSEKEILKDKIDTIYRYLTDLSDKQYLSYLVFGRQGDNKSTMMQYAQYQMLKRDPGAIFMVHDRKFYASGNEDSKFPSVWSGIPVYDSVRTLAGTSVPFSHLLSEDIPDLLTWLKPIEELYNYRNSNQPKEGDPLYDKAHKRIRPVIVVMEDMTTTLEDYKIKCGSTNKAAYDKAVNLLSRLATLMRSSKIYAWFVTHDCTTSATDIPQRILEQLHPIIGSSFAGNRKQLTLVKEEPIEEGLQLALASGSQKVKGFATAFAKAPYIPPAPLKSTFDMVDSETVVNSHYGAVKGFVVMDYHKRAIAKLGLKEADLGTISMADVVVSSTVSPSKPSSSTRAPKSAAIPVVPVESTAFDDPDFDPTDMLSAPDKSNSDESDYPDWSAEANSGSEEVEKAAIAAKIINLRRWYKSYGKKAPTTDEVKDQIAFDFNISEDMAGSKLPELMPWLLCNEKRFGTELLDDPTYKDEVE